MTTRKSGIVIPNRLPWHLRLAVWALTWIARSILYSWRLRLTQPISPLADNGPAIFCIWHNRLSLAVIMWTKVVRHYWPANGMTAVISASKDGAILAEVVGNFGIHTVRGSTSRRGPQALLEAVGWLQKNCNVAITPDGPRGPCYHIQPGVIQLAQVTGRPIIFTTSRIYSKFSFKSWDRFQVPLPFSRCDIVFGAPIYVPRDATDEEREQLRLRLEKEMLAATVD
jgi:lysophospholipid acyltransferase (LPLAT)-like uncharacterized protein